MTMKKIPKARISASVISFGLALAFPGISHSATEVCGTLSLATEWIAKSSPYIVTNDIFIPANSRLRIGPGVIVKFTKPKPCKEQLDGKEPIPQEDWADSAYSGIKAEGTFYTLGTEEHPVLMEPAEPKPGTVSWDGIRLTGERAGAAEIGFTVFRGANQAITVDHSAFFIHHCLFEGNNTGILAGMRGDVGIVNCNFIGNLSAGIVIRKGSPRIANNIFQGNRSYGIWADGRPAIQTWNNAFWQNREENCFKCPYAVLDEVNLNANKDSSDRYGNLTADPMFIGSPTWKAAEALDIETSTPVHLIKDENLAKLEADATAKREKEEKASKDKDKDKKRKKFVQVGNGPYLLSKYSKLVDAGHKGRDFQDRDGTVNDIGMHGGPMGRITSDPF